MFGNSTYIIGEIGINHNGDLGVVKRLIDIAVVAGFDAVKFQKRNPNKCVPGHQKKVMRQTPWGQMPYIDYKRRVEFGRREYNAIDRYCMQKGIEWLNPSNTLAAQTYMIIFIILFIQFRPRGIVALKGRAAGD